MKRVLLALSTFVLFCVVACSTATGPAVDDETSSSSTKKSSSSVSKYESSSSHKVSSSSSESEGEESSSSVKVSSSSEEDGETCVGEPGKAWDGTTAKEFACGHGTKRSPYIILTAEQLAKLSFVVGAKDSKYDADTYFKLGADIILHEDQLIDEDGALVADSTKLIKWTPIGNSNISFAAHFDGDGHSVRGIFINTSSTHNGLFGNVSGEVKNVTVKDSWVHGGKYTAGVAGYNVGTLENVRNEASVTGTDECMGGVVGKSYRKSYTYNSVLTNVKNKGIVVGKNSVGGVAGCVSYVTVDGAFNEAEINGQHFVAGVFGGIGSSSDNDVKKVENHGKVFGKHFVGGIAGYCGGTVSTSGTVSCYSYSNSCGSISYALNTNSITGENGTAGVVGAVCNAEISNAGNTGNIEGKISTAGVIGYAGNSTTSSLYNIGNVYGSKKVGGVIGHNQEGVTSAAYSVGAVEGEEDEGLVIGYNYNTTMADYYYLAQEGIEPFGTNDGGGFATAKTAEEMMSDDFVELLGSDFAIVENFNKGYPLLKWEIEE